MLARNAFCANKRLYTVVHYSISINSRTSISNISSIIVGVVINVVVMILESKMTKRPNIQ